MKSTTIISSLLLTTLSLANPTPAPAPAAASTSSPAPTSTTTHSTDGPLSQVTGNFQYLATKSYANQHSMLWSSITSSVAHSMSTQPAWSSFESWCATDLSTSKVSFNDDTPINQLVGNCDPIAMATDAVNPTTTPDWVVKMPKDQQVFISSVDGALQSAVMKNGEGLVSLNVQGMVLAVAMAVVAYL